MARVDVGLTVSPKRERTQCDGGDACPSACWEKAADSSQSVYSRHTSQKPVAFVRGLPVLTHTYHSEAMLRSGEVRSCRPAGEHPDFSNKTPLMHSHVDSMLILFCVCSKELWEKPPPSSTDTFPTNISFPWPLVSTMPKLQGDTGESRASELSRDLSEVEQTDKSNLTVPLLS